MPSNSETGGARAPAKDRIEDDEAFWTEVFAQLLQKPHGTPPWDTIDTCHTDCAEHEDSHPSLDFDNQLPLYQYHPVGLSRSLGIDTPPVSSTASSQGFYDAGPHPVQYNVQEPALFTSNNDNNQDNSQFNIGPPIFVFNPQGLNTHEYPTSAPWHGPSEPASLDHQINSAGGWQFASPSSIDEDANRFQFLPSIEHAEPLQYTDLQSERVTGPVQQYGSSTSQGYPTDLILTAGPHIHTERDSRHVHQGTVRDGSVTSNIQHARGVNAHPLSGDQPQPTKRLRISGPSPSKHKKFERTKVIQRGPVEQHVFATDDHVGRATYDPQRLKMVNERRKTGACILCKWRKKTCEMPKGSTEKLGEAPCMGCTRSMNDLGPHICFIFNINNIYMFRPHSPLHSRAATDPIEFLPGTTKWIEIRLTGALPSEPIKVECLEFRPHNDDVLVKIFGSSQQIPMSPYAIVNLDNYKKKLSPMLPALTETFLEDLKRTGCSNAVSKTFRAAVRYRDEHPTSLVAEALRIWVYSKLCGTEKVLIGAQQFGVAPVQEEGAELEGMVPVPPKIDHQTDTAMIDSMKKDAPRLVERLKKLIDRKNRNDWYEIFLTVFVILNNIEYILKRQKLFLADVYKYRDRLRDIVQPSELCNKDMKRVERCINGSEQLISDFKQSADQILQIYQLYASTKRAPFAVKRTKKELKEASLLPHEIEYVVSMQNDADDLINQDRDEHEPKHHRHEKGWAAQLFQQLD